MFKSITHTPHVVIFLSVTMAIMMLFSINLRAQTGTEGVEITRDGTDLRTAIVDPDIAFYQLNTALVLTNQQNSDRRVWCRAWSAGGEPIGRAWTKLPAHGTRLIFASDMTDRPFVGKITCSTNVAVHASAFIIGSAFTQTDVTNRTTLNSNQIIVHAAVLH